MTEKKDSESKTPGSPEKSKADKKPGQETNKPNEIIEPTEFGYGQDIKKRKYNLNDTEIKNKIDPDKSNTSQEQSHENIIE